MNEYVARKGQPLVRGDLRGTRPVTGLEIRRWQAACTDKTSAERLARRLERELNGRADRGRGLTFVEPPMNAIVTCGVLNVGTTSNPALRAAEDALHELELE